jgi:hypothetical protein
MLFSIISKSRGADYIAIYNFVEVYGENCLRLLPLAVIEKLGQDARGIWEALEGIKESDAAELDNENDYYIAAEIKQPGFVVHVDSEAGLNEMLGYFRDHKIDIIGTFFNGISNCSYKKNIFIVT